MTRFDIELKWDIGSLSYFPSRSAGAKCIYYTSRQRPWIQLPLFPSIITIISPNNVRSSSFVANLRELNGAAYNRDEFHHTVSRYIVYPYPTYPNLLSDASSATIRTAEVPASKEPPPPAKNMSARSSGSPTPRHVMYSFSRASTPAART